MPKRIFKSLNPVSCRCCGATQAEPHPNEYGICATCYFGISWQSKGDSRISELDVATYLVRKMKSHVKRATNGKPITRCECISANANSRTGRGYQCGSVANYQRDGRWVCHSHIRSDDVVFVDQQAPDAYAQIAQYLRDLIEFDQKMKDVFREAGA